MAIPTFDAGDGLTATAQFKSRNGAAADPSSVTFELLSPDEQTTSPSVFRNDVGSYFSDFGATNPAGVWEYRWKGTGAVQAVLAGKFVVRASPFA